MRAQAAVVGGPHPVLILGCGRSGTSIFGELFDGLGPYGYRSEPPYLEVTEQRGDRPWAVKVPRESDGFPPDPGLSFPVDDFLARYPLVNIFWIVRHPLDAISSLRVGIAEDWRHHPRPADWRRWLERPLIERCAHHWRHINTLGFGRVRSRAHLVHFEAMIRTPHAFAHRIANTVGLAASEHEQRLSAWAARVQDTNNAAFVEAQTSRNLSRPDHSVRVGRWRENLSLDERRVAAGMVAEAARVFGYDLQECLG